MPILTSSFKKPNICTSPVTQIKSYLIGTAGNGFSNIVVDNDGFLWVSEGYDVNKVHKIDPSNGSIILSTIAVGNNPRGLTMDSQGYLWCAWYGAFLVVRIDPSDGSILNQYNLSTPWNITTTVTGSAAGWIWVTGDNTNDMYGWDPTNLGSNPNVTVTDADPFSPRGLHADQIGNLWITSSDNQLRHYNPSTSTLTNLGGGRGTGIGADTNGIMYFPSDGSVGDFYRSDINTLADLGTLLTPNASLYRQYGDGFIDNDNFYWGTDGNKVNLITTDTILISGASDAGLSGSKQTIQTNDGHVWHVYGNYLREYDCS